MKYLLFLLSTFAVAFGCSSLARQAERASDADSAVVADVADSSTECQGLPLRAIWLIR